MKRLTLLLLSILLLNVFTNSCLLSQEIKTDNIKAHITYLASDKLHGRKPSDSGGKMAAEYIKGQFKKAGLLPLADDYYQYFEVVKDIRATDNNSFKFDDFEGEMNKDFIPFSFTANAELNAEVRFAGYGFDIDDDNLKYNDYENIDVKGKWVMIILGNIVIEKTDGNLSFVGTVRSRVLTAKDKGAAGVLIAMGMEFSKKDELISLFYDKSEARADIPVINITRAVANKILSSKIITIEELEKKINETHKPNSFEIPVKIKAQTDVIHKKVKTENVIGLIPGSSDEFIVIGAHYDHLGMGGPGSGSRKPDTVAVHHGADDNASGVAGIIELAKKLSNNKDKLKRNIVLAAFSAEEMGLLGSMKFVKEPMIDLKKVKAMFNFDMLGRLKANKTILAGGTGTSVETDSLLDFHLKGKELKLAKSTGGFGPSDHAEDIPVFFFSTGAHEDYHKPEDDINKINFEGEKLILDFLYDLVFDVANIEHGLTFTEAGPKTRTGAGKYKVKLGFMPDFATADKPGVGVGGVTKDSPAEMGGMLKGDIIVAIDGKSIKDIYEYMHRLKQLEPGQMITVDVMRNGERVVLLIQL
ncbi:M20/M25/M40 family metallo-hydrolase [Bacteroidota bacterium]